MLGNYQILVFFRQPAVEDGLERVLFGFNKS